MIFESSFNPYIFPCWTREIWNRNINATKKPVEGEEEDDDENYLFAETVDEEETLSLEAKEIELIKKSLDRNKGKRKAAADELGISERTLCRKIKQYDL